MLSGFVMSWFICVWEWRVPYVAWVPLLHGAAAVGRFFFLGGRRHVARKIEVLQAFLPHIIKCEPELLDNKTFFVVTHEPSKIIVACGGWSQARVGTEEVTEGLGHLRQCLEPADVGRGLLSRWWQLRDFLNFHPEPWGNDPIWLAHFFSDGLVQTSTRI